MKIDIVVKYFYPVAAGIETNTLETYSVLAKYGHKVTVHASKDNYLVKNALKSREEFRGIKILRYPFESDLSGYMPEIDWENTDMVCLHNFNVSHFRILAKILWMKATGRKKFAVVITPHGGFNPEWKVFGFKTRIIKFLYQYSIGTLISNLTADGFRAVSEWERCEMIKKGISAKKIRVITNGLEDEAYMDVEKKASSAIKKRVSGYGNYIIQIGRVYPIKNYETVIKALPYIDPKINYVIVGQTQDEKYLEKLKNLAKSLGVENRVKFAGIVRGVDKYYIIKRAKMMVHMAMWESFCNVVHEGLSQGLVCIVANNTALPLLVKNGVNGFVVNTYDSQSLAKKVNYVLGNFSGKKIKAIQLNNKTIAENESWTAVAEKMREYYQELVNKVKKN